MCRSLLTPGGGPGKFSGGLAPPPRPGRSGGFSGIRGSTEAPGDCREQQEAVFAFLLFTKKKRALERTLGFKTSFICSKECGWVEPNPAALSLTF